MEWFIEASWRLWRHRVGSGCTLNLFPAGFVDPEKWFHSHFPWGFGDAGRHAGSGADRNPQIPQPGLNRAALSTRVGVRQSVKIACLAPLGALR
jgi:hypothetical protein